MFSLRDLRFVLCSRDLDVLRAQRIMGLITHKSTGSDNRSLTDGDHDIRWCVFVLQLEDGTWVIDEEQSLTIKTNYVISAFGSTISDNAGD